METILSDHIAVIGRCRTGTAPPLPRTTNASKADCDPVVSSARQLGDSIVGGLLGLQITKTYSLEVRYDYIDTVYQPNTTIKSSSTGVAAVGMYPVKFGDIEPFFIFGKAGYERTTTKSTTFDPGIPGLLLPATTTVTTTVRKRVTRGRRRAI